MGEAQITAFCCCNALYAGLPREEVQKACVEGVQIIEIPCSGKVDPIYLLKAFEKGADGVVVLACDPCLCATLEGSARIRKRVERTQRLLAEAGLEPGWLVLQVVKRPALPALEAIFAGIKETIREMGPTPVGAHTGGNG